MEDFTYFIELICQVCCLLYTIFLYIYIFNFFRVVQEKYFSGVSTQITVFSLNVQIYMFLIIFSCSLHSQEIPTLSIIMKTNFIPDSALLIYFCALFTLFLIYLSSWLKCIFKATSNHFLKMSLNKSIIKQINSY